MTADREGTKPVEEPQEPERQDLADLEAAFAIDVEAANATVDRIAGLVVNDGRWRDALIDLLLGTRSVPFVEAVAIAAAQSLVDYLIRAARLGLPGTMIRRRHDNLVFYASTLETRGARQLKELNARDEPDAGPDN